jgi:hypothetical protein
MTATCETCRFFHVTSETPCGNYGLCRKNAPVRVAGEQDGWPGTSDALGCGEHQPLAAAALSATPPRPALAPETRRLLEDAMRGICRAQGALSPGRLYALLDRHAEDIRAHLAAHGGGDE